MSLIYNYTFAKTDEVGDGIGTIAEIGLLKAQPFLQNDKTKIVVPFMVVPTPIDDNWWVVKQFLAIFFSPDNVYDVLCILFWLLNFLAGFYLFQTLKLNDFAAVIFGLTLAGLEVYYVRITGHLTMAAIFIPILQIAYAIKVTESPSRKNIIFFSILSFACFLSNEYYGYFGFIFSFVLILFYFLMNFKKLKEFSITGFILGAMIFLSGMAVIYRRVFLALLTRNTTSSLIVHSYFEHVFYSVKNPLEILYSDLYGLNIPLANPWEFTFHLGIIIVIFIFVFLLYAIIKRIRLDYKLILAILFSGVVLSLFGLDPDYPLSLERITYNLAPQFRVGARAYLWVSFALILIAAIIYRDVVRAEDPVKTGRNSIMSPLLSFLLIILMVDTTLGFYIKGPRLYPLPENTAYKFIAGFPQGLLLELPFYGPSESQANYRYIYNYIDHKKEFVNYPTQLMVQYDPILATGLEQFKYYLNNPNRDVIDRLRRAGIKYIAVSDPKIKKRFDSMGYAPLIYEGETAIYEFDATNELDLKSLVLCNKFLLEYDLSVSQNLSSNVGTWTDSGISSSGGVEGALLYGPYAPLNAGTYSFKMYGTLTSGTVNVDITSHGGTVVYEKFTLDKSMADSSGEFVIQKELVLDKDVSDLEVRVWVNKDSQVEIQGYAINFPNPIPQCQDLLFNNKLH